MVPISSLNLPSTLNLDEALAKLNPRDHLCLIYESQEEWPGMAIPFLVMGLKQGEKCVYAGTSRPLNQCRARLLTDTLEHSSQAFFMGHPNGHIIAWDHAFRELAGYSDEELGKVNWREDLTPPEWRRFEVMSRIHLSSQREDSDER